MAMDAAIGNVIVMTTAVGKVSGGLDMRILSVTITATITAIVIASLGVNKSWASASISEVRNNRGRTTALVLVRRVLVENPRLDPVAILAQASKSLSAPKFLRPATETRR